MAGQTSLDCSSTATWCSRTPSPQRGTKQEYITSINIEAYRAGWLDTTSVKPSKQFNIKFPYVHKLPKEKKPTDAENTNLLYCKDLRSSERKRNQDKYKRSISKVVVGDNGQVLQFTDQEDVTHDITLETLITMGYVQDYTGSHSSSNLDRFHAYWKHVLSDFYQNQQQQHRRYQAQLGVRSSESNLARNIQSKFKGGDCKVELGSAESWARTSRIYIQFCPHCDSDVGHPLSQLTSDGRTREIHHLLRCKNESCSRWWQRDLLPTLSGKLSTDWSMEKPTPFSVLSPKPKPNPNAGGGGGGGGGGKKRKSSNETVVMEQVIKR
ncbi:hypothetical protein BJ741DRAFT_700088 [Chytriomyces cf. hyalinus JEL632]|nr:hypothetical protein BJ741DRAFT_700088 [Chytriomyces cf. hyalinus JEL632]